MLPLARVRFLMVCVTNVATISVTTSHFLLRAMGVTHVDVIRVPGSTE